MPRVCQSLSRPCDPGHLSTIWTGASGPTSSHATGAHFRNFARHCRTWSLTCADTEAMLSPGFMGFLCVSADPWLRPAKRCRPASDSKPAILLDIGLFETMPASDPKPLIIKANFTKTSKNDIKMGGTSHLFFTRKVCGTPLFFGRFGPPGANTL